MYESKINELRLRRAEDGGIEVYINGAEVHGVIEFEVINPQTDLEIDGHGMLIPSFSRPVVVLRISNVEIKQSAGGISNA